MNVGEPEPFALPSAVLGEKLHGYLVQPSGPPVGVAYLLHGRGTVDLEESIAALVSLREAGLIRHWGVADFALPALAELLADKEEQIVNQLIAVQGSPADIGGYYRPDAEKAAAVMRPSATLNAALASLA